MGSGKVRDNEREWTYFKNESVIGVIGVVLQISRCDSPSKESKEIERTKGEVRKKQKTKD